jgi:hypothetical protein
LGGFAQKVGNMAKMKQPKCEDMWAVFNPEIGFYIGTWLTRAEAKHYHAQNTTQNGDWEFCKKRGDIVMRVQITAAQPALAGGRKARVRSDKSKSVGALRR